MEESCEELASLERLFSADSSVVEGQCVAVRRGAVALRTIPFCNEHCALLERIGFFVNAANDVRDDDVDATCRTKTTYVLD
jgi:hypothetical protein